MDPSVSGALLALAAAAAAPGTARPPLELVGVVATAKPGVDGADLAQVIADSGLWCSSAQEEHITLALDRPVPVSAVRVELRIDGGFFGKSGADARSVHAAAGASHVRAENLLDGRYIARFPDGTPVRSVEVVLVRAPDDGWEHETCLDSIVLETRAHQVQLVPFVAAGPLERLAADAAALLDEMERCDFTGRVSPDSLPYVESRPDPAVSEFQRAVKEITRVETDAQLGALCKALPGSGRVEATMHPQSATELVLRTSKEWTLTLVWRQGRWQLVRVSRALP